MPRRRLAIALAVAAALVVWGAALLTAIRLGSSLLSAPVSYTHLTLPTNREV